MDEYHQQEAMIAVLPTQALLGLIKLDSRQLREAFLPSPTACLHAFEQLLPVLGAAKVSRLLGEINEGNSTLGKVVDSESRSRLGVEEFCLYLEFLEDIQARQDDIYEAFEEVEQHYDLMEEQNIDVPEQQKAEYLSLANGYGNLKAAIELSEG